MSDDAGELETDGGVAVDRGGNGRAPHFGDRIESWACDVFGMEYVDETAHDSLLEDGTPVQIKGAQLWVGNGYRNGEPQRCRGRIKLWEGDHETLVDEGGLYLIVVYTVNSDGINVLASDWFEPEDVADVVGGDWYSEGDPRERSKGLVYRTTWPAFFPDLEGVFEE